MYLVCDPLSPSQNTFAGFQCKWHVGILCSFCLRLTRSSKWFPEIGKHSSSLPRWPRRWTFLGLLFSSSWELISRNSPSNKNKNRALRNQRTNRGSFLQVQKLQRAALKNPVKCAVSSKYQTVEKLQQYYLFIPSKFKVECLLWSFLPFPLLLHHSVWKCQLLIS